MVFLIERKLFAEKEVFGRESRTRTQAQPQKPHGIEK
jgi:hypothetical protein